MAKQSTLNFPYYSLRQYDRIYVEGDLKIISTYWGNYVLDEANPAPGSTLAERRLNLMGRQLNLRLYRLESRCTNVAQMLTASNKVFIDAYGNIKKIKKPKRYRLTCCKVLSIVELGYMKYGISFLLDGVVEYFVHNTPSNYVQVLVLDTGWLYFDSLAEHKPDSSRGL